MEMGFRQFWKNVLTNRIFFKPNIWQDRMLEWTETFCPTGTTFRGVILFVFILLLDCSVFVASFMVPLNMESGSYLLDHGVTSILLIATSGSVVKLSHMLSQKNRIRKISSSLQFFDNTIQRMDFRMRCGEVNYWTIALSVTFFIATFLLSVAVAMFGKMVFSNIESAIMMVVFINIVNIPYIVFFIWFMIYEFCVWCRLKLLCKLVKNGIHMSTSKRRKDIAMLCQLVLGLSDLHYELSIVVLHINSLFLVQVFMCFSAYSSLLIFTVFSYYRAALVMGEKESNFAWLTISWSIYNSLFVLPGICLAAWVRIDANRLAKFIHRFLRLADDTKLQNQLSILSQQLQHCPLGPTACFTKIDWASYASIIGYISTYVVILIQFDSKSVEISKLNQLASM